MVIGVATKADGVCSGTQVEEDLKSSFGWDGLEGKHRESKS